MRKLFEPVAGPPWVKQTLASIRSALTDVWPAPLRLWLVATASLPAASERKGGLVYDITTDEVKRSNGSAWTGLSVSGHDHSSTDIPDFAEAVRDRVGSTLVAGTGITVIADDPGDTIIIATTITQYSDENARDALAAALAAGAGITIAPNDGADTIAIACTISQYSDEMARDALGAALVAGAGISITPGDPADTINVASTITQYTDEHAQDAVGTILTDSATIDFTYDDAGGTITATVKDDSITYARIQNVSATDKVLGRSSSGAGDVQEIACTGAGRSMIAAADAQAQRTLLRSGCMVRRSTSLIGQNWTGSPAAIAWDAEVYDDGGYHDNFTNNSRLTTLSGQTRVRVGCMIAIANLATTDQLQVIILKTGSAAWDGRVASNQIAGVAGARVNLASGPVPITGGTDYFEVQIITSADTSADLTAALSSFWIEAC